MGNFSHRPAKNIWINDWPMVSVVGFVVIFATYFVAKIKLNFGMFLNMICFGIFLDLILWLDFIPELQSIWASLLIFLAVLLFWLSESGCISLLL